MPAQAAPTRAPDISVVICTYNRAEQLRATLQTLLAQTVPADLQWEVLIVDNNSKDHTRAVADWFAGASPCPVRYVFESRQGKSHALNTSIRESRGEIIAFTDDDVFVDKDWLAALWRAFKADAHCVGVAGRITARWDAPRPAWFATVGPYRLMQAVVEYDCGPARRAIRPDEAPYGANVAFRRAAMAKNGDFRTDLGPTGQALLRGEDTEYAGRMLERGDVILYVPDAIVVHPVEPYRLRKGYFRRWYYNYGRTLSRIDPQREMKRLFGVPRYVFRELLEAMGTWAVTRGAQRRFFHELRCCQAVGTIVEHYGRPSAS